MNSNLIIQNKNNKKSKICDPEVSIIIPVYNVEKWIARTIESIKNQVYQNYEAIIVDDGSTDNTKNIILKYTCDPRIKLILRNHQGVSSARNYGLINSKGKYIAFLDGDDYWDINFLSDMINHIEKSDSDICFCGVRAVDENKRLLFENFPNIEIFNGKVLSNYLLGDIQIPTGSYIVKKDIINKYNLKYSEDCKVFEDQEFRIKLLAVGRVSCVKEILLNGTQRKNSTSKVFEPVYLDSLIIFERSISFLKSNLPRRESKMYIFEIMTHTLPWRVASLFVLASLNGYKIKDNKYKIYLFKFIPHSSGDLINYLFHIFFIYFPNKSFLIKLNKIKKMRV